MKSAVISSVATMFLLPVMRNESKRGGAFDARA
jgi:hypothetical protein